MGGIGSEGAWVCGWRGSNSGEGGVSVEVQKILVWVTKNGVGRVKILAWVAWV